MPRAGRPRPGRRSRRAGTCCWSCRSARPSSTGRTCRCPPTRTWRSRWRRGSRPDGRRAGRAAACRTGRAASTPASPARSRSAPAATELLLVELGRSALPATARRMLLVSAHGGNAEPVTAAVRLLRSRGPGRAGVVAALAGRRARRPYRDLGAAGAGRRPGPADRARPATPAPLPTLLPALRAGGVRAVSPNGVLGDPAGASAAEGRGPARRRRRDLAASPTGERMPPVALAPRFVDGRRDAGSRWSPAPPAASARRPYGRWPPRAGRWSRVDRAADDPRLPYGLGTRAELDALAGDRVRHRGRRRHATAAALRGGRRAGRARVRRPGRGARRGRRDRRRPAAVGDAGRRAATPCSTSTCTPC